MKKITIGAIIAYAALSQVTDVQSGKIDSLTIDPNAQIDLMNDDKQTVDQTQKIDTTSSVNTSLQVDPTIQID